MEQRKTIIVDGYNLNIVFGKTKTEWVEKHKNYDTEDELWDFPINELLDGTIEPNEGLWYWLINGRLYETFDLVGYEDKLKLTDELEAKIREAIGEDYSELDIEERLTELLHRSVDMYDYGIDDGVGSEDDEDEYVMKACYKVEGTRITIRIYFGNITEKIGYVDIREN